jgi:hypothetical protein
VWQPRFPQVVFSGESRKSRCSNKIGNRKGMWKSIFAPCHTDSKRGSGRWGGRPLGAWVMEVLNNPRVLQARGCREGRPSWTYAGCRTAPNLTSLCRYHSARSIGRLVQFPPVRMYRRKPSLDNWFPSALPATAKQFLRSRPLSREAQQQHRKQDAGGCDRPAGNVCYNSDRNENGHGHICGCLRQSLRGLQPQQESYSRRQ